MGLMRREKIQRDRRLQYLAAGTDAAEVARLKSLGVDLVAAALEGSSYSTPDKVLDNSDIVVVARPVGLKTLDGDISDGYYSTVYVLVEEVIKGKFSPGDTIFIRQFSGVATDGIACLARGEIVSLTPNAMGLTYTHKGQSELLLLSKGQYGFRVSQAGNIPRTDRDYHILLGVKGDSVGSNVVPLATTNLRQLRESAKRYKGVNNH